MEGRLMSDLKHYNIFALRGDTETTDQDVCATLGLDPRLANTPAINDAAIKAMHRENYESYLDRGLDSTSALSLADKLADDIRSQIKELSK
jgi:hypothetical protein